MILPSFLQQKIDDLFLRFDKNKLTSGREKLTEKYMTNQAINKSVFETSDDSAIYAISRMPATYVVNFILLEDLLSQNLISDVKTIVDIGSGTGAGFFACRDIFEDAEISLYERDVNMIKIFDEFDTGEKVNRFDFIRDEINEKADLVMSSYVFSELNEEGRKIALKKMIDASNKYVLVIDTGTPRTYENFMKLKKLALDWGYKIIAPCLSEKCGLKNDYCQFYARVERSALMKLSKQAELSYEDEKYSYMAFVKNECNRATARILRHPYIEKGQIGLEICSRKDNRSVQVKKKDGKLFKVARKAKHGDSIEIE